MSDKNKETKKGKKLPGNGKHCQECNTTPAWDFNSNVQGRYCRDCFNKKLLLVLTGVGAVLVLIGIWLF